MKNNQSGFSLIELLLVVVIIGVIAAIAVPSLMRARYSAENASAYSSMRSLSTLQVRYYTNNNRFGSMDEILRDQQTNLGTYENGTLRKGSFSFQMEPGVTEELLKREYKIIATRPAFGNSTPFILEVDHTGRITQVLER
ncbi:MAG: putative Pilin, type [Acidobacteria bacterium]|jgi:prepilin-type N-terminal cleavage/methylation domain-containing protein|nr:putative Pilin, type [Acidobacteriota bacterium]